MLPAMATLCNATATVSAGDAQGLMDRVLDRTDSYAVQLLAGAVIWVVRSCMPGDA